MAEFLGQDGEAQIDRRIVRRCLSVSTIEQRGQPIAFFRYIRHAQRAAAEAEGWTFAADLGTYHGQYCVLMEKAGEPSFAGLGIVDQAKEDQALALEGSPTIL